MHLIQEKLESHLKESMNAYPELMFENLKVVEYFEVKLGCTQLVLLQQFKRWSSKKEESLETLGLETRNEG